MRRLRGRWWFAAIRPRGRGERTWALPKGIVDPGEGPAATAVREAAEETGLEVELFGGRDSTLSSKLGDVRYVYTRRGTGERVFKVVSFYLLRYRRGRIGDIPPALAFEVAEACWLPLEDGARHLSYGGEREMVEKAIKVLESQTV